MLPYLLDRMVTMMLICDQRNAKPMTVTSIYGIVASISNLSSQNAAAKPIC